MPRLTPKRKAQIAELLGKIEHPRPEYSLARMALTLAKELLAALDAQWQPIATCPVDVDVLVYVPNATYGGFVGAWQFYKEVDGYVEYAGNPCRSGTSTHWMPSPKPPIVEGEK